MYKINPSVYRGVVVLPAEIAEKLLTLTGEKELKTIIYVFSRPSGLFVGEEVARAVGITEHEARDALAYWEDLGYLLSASAPSAEMSETAPEDISVIIPKAGGSDTDIAAGDGVSKTGDGEKPDPGSGSSADRKKSGPTNTVPAPTHLSHADICRRVEESAEVRFLLSEAQPRLGRTAGTVDQSSLLLLHDYYGLPVEVILSICEYARLHGKSGSMNYIFTVGVDWSKREIDTLEKADEEFKTLELIDVKWKEFISLTGLNVPRATLYQQKYFSRWVNEWKQSVALIGKAYEETIENLGKPNFPYMNKILSSWREKGIATPEDADTDKRERMLAAESRAAAKSKKTQVNPVADTGRIPSYNIEEAENRAKTSVPVLKKRSRGGSLA